MLAQARPEGPSGEFLRYESSLLLSCRMLNYNSSHPSFHLLTGEEGKRSPLANVKMRIALWFVFCSFSHLHREPRVTAAARNGSGEVLGNRMNLSLFVLLLSWWIISAAIRPVVSSGRLYYTCELIYFWRSISVCSKCLSPDSMVWERLSGLFLCSKYNERAGLLPIMETGGGNSNMQHLRKKSDKNKTSFRG